MPDYLKLAEGEAIGTPSANPYLDLLSTDADQQKAQTAASLNSAVDVNPDQYATKRRVASYLGYPTAAVDAQPVATERQAKIKQIDADTARAPLLAQKYADADFARLAHDDSGTLSKITDAVRYVFGAPGANGGLATDLIAGPFDALSGAAGAFRAAVEFVAPVGDALEAAPSIGGNPLRRLAEGFGLQGIHAKRVADALSPPQAGIVSGGERPDGGRDARSAARQCRAPERAGHSACRPLRAFGDH